MLEMIPMEEDPRASGDLGPIFIREMCLGLEEILALLANHLVLASTEEEVGPCLELSEARAEWEAVEPWLRVEVASLGAMSVEDMFNRDLRITSLTAEAVGQVEV